MTDQTNATNDNVAAGFGQMFAGMQQVFNGMMNPQGSAGSSPVTQTSVDTKTLNKGGQQMQKGGQQMANGVSTFMSGEPEDMTFGKMMKSHQQMTKGMVNFQEGARKSAAAMESGTGSQRASNSQKCDIKQFFMPFPPEFIFTRESSYQYDYELGIAAPKGMILHYPDAGIYISKDGIAYYIRNAYNGNCGYLFLARFWAIFELITFVFSLLFTIPIYICTLVYCLLMGLVLIPTLPCKFFMHPLGWCCGMASPTTNRDCWVLFWGGIYKVLVGFVMIVIHLALSPLQIIIPEFTALALQQHKWGTRQFDNLAG